MNGTQDKSNITINDFSVDTLIDSNTFKSSISDDYLINKIKQNKEKELKKTIELYESKYRECLIHINTGIELNMIEVIFSIECFYFGYQNFNSIECLKYIEKKLNEKNFLTLILSNKDIYISWHNINS